jgi:hypothetical protein
MFRSVLSADNLLEGLPPGPGSHDAGVNALLPFQQQQNLRPLVSLHPGDMCSAHAHHSLVAALDLLGTLHGGGGLAALEAVDAAVGRCFDAPQAAAHSLGHGNGGSGIGMGTPAGIAPTDGPTGSDDTQQDAAWQQQNRPGHGGRPVRRAARQAAASLTRSQRTAYAAPSSGDDGGSSDSEGGGGVQRHGSSAPDSPGERAAGRAPPAPQQGGKKRRGATAGRPLQRKAYDALVDPQLPPDEVRRVRRMLSNRESARRARQRREQQVSVLEGELAAAHGEADALRRELAAAGAAAAAAAADRDRLAAELAAARAEADAAARLAMSRSPSDLQVSQSDPLPCRHACVKCPVARCRRHPSRALAPPARSPMQLLKRPDAGAADHPLFMDDLGLH